MLSTADLIYQEAKTLPESLGDAVLDFIDYLRTRHCVMPAPGDKVAKLAELEEFFAPYQRNLSDFQFRE